MHAARFTTWPLLLLSMAAATALAAESRFELVGHLRRTEAHEPGARFALSASLQVARPPASPARFSLDARMQAATAPLACVNASDHLFRNGFE